ncbi:hypothetical protein GQE99_19275 [Maritimibacter sp. DP07]|uniref:Short chain dehydrogenase n=1 Tax=Maritimibacter harenae TaxID=2606218 RepID=A0A845M550_9RHOB|nr:hypothetical protein [Maritimibacter harenae]MZR15165.1 hypothetical protein [Maritimibacter harenae]
MMRYLITGANRGIGAVLARAAEERGHSVIRHGRTKRGVICDLAERLDDSGKFFRFSGGERAF